MPQERVRVDVIRSGGIAGISRSASLDTDDLDEEQAARLNDLLQECQLETESQVLPVSTGGGADRFQYDITIVRDSETHSFVLREPGLSPSQQRLVRWVLAEGRTGT